MYKRYNKFDNANMSMAFITANLSYCQRRKVGAVIVRDDRIIANGYNGTLKGTDNSCEDKILICGQCGRNNVLDKDLSEYSFSKYPNQERLSAVMSKVVTEEDIYKAKNSLYHTCENPECDAMIIFAEEHVGLKTNNNVIHAEQNAILFAANHGISVKDTTMFVTTAPCLECAKAIAGSGIKEVIWKDIYKNFDGIEYLQANGVECYRYDIVGDINVQNTI